MWETEGHSLVLTKVEVRNLVNHHVDTLRFSVSPIAHVLMKDFKDLCIPNSRNSNQGLIFLFFFFKKVFCK